MMGGEQGVGDTPDVEAAVAGLLFMQQMPVANVEGCEADDDEAGDQDCCESPPQAQQLQQQQQHQQQQHQQQQQQPVAGRVIQTYKYCKLYDNRSILRTTFDGLFLRRRFVAHVDTGNRATTAISLLQRRMRGP